MQNSFQQGMRRLLAVVMTAGILIGTAAALSASPLRSSVVRDKVPAGWWGSGVGYPRLLQLHNSTRGENNVFLATFEEGKAGIGPGSPGYPIYRSADLGKTWSHITTVYDPVNTSSQQAEWQPFLYELPEDCGNLKKGTILLAGCSVDAAHSQHSCLQLYQSTDGGYSWSFLSTIAVGGGLETGVWEPFLLMVDGELLCYYSDSTENLAHSQKIVYRSSLDGRSWSHPVDVIASPKQSDRPGMPIITRMGDGRYFMVYELVNNETGNGNPICCKFSNDGKYWGDVASTGTILASGGKTLGSAPYCIWSPVGGSCGTLFVGGTFMRSGQSQTGTDYFVSTDYGTSWSTTAYPIPYDPRYAGYSSPMALSADGKLLFVLNNPTDPNGVTPAEGRNARARIEFALVELVQGAASLPENQPAFSSNVTTATSSGSTTSRTQGSSTTAHRSHGGSTTAPSEATNVSTTYTVGSTSSTYTSSLPNSLPVTTQTADTAAANPWDLPLTLIGLGMIAAGGVVMAVTFTRYFRRSRKD